MVQQRQQWQWGEGAGVCKVNSINGLLRIFTLGEIFRRLHSAAKQFFFFFFEINQVSYFTCLSHPLKITTPLIMLSHHIACSISCVSVFQSNLMQYLRIYFIAQSHILLWDLTTVKEKRTQIYEKCLHTLRKYIVPKS